MKSSESVRESSCESQIINMFMRLQKKIAFILDLGLGWVNVFFLILFSTSPKVMLVEFTKNLLEWQNNFEVLKHVLQKGGGDI